MHKLNLQANNRADQIATTTKTFFGKKVPEYIKSLPSIKNDAKRWALNTLYFGVGLMFNWAVSAVLRQMPNMHKFPSNVAGMIVLLFFLLSSNAVFPKLTDKFVQIVDPYSTFALKSMNIMFVPAVVEIVNNPPTTGPEIGRMICVFLVAYVIAFLICTVVVRSIRLIFFAPIFTAKKSKPEPSLNESLSLRTHPSLKEEPVELGAPPFTHPNQVSSFLSLEMPPRCVSDDAASNVSTLNVISPAVNSTSTSDTDIDTPPTANSNIYEPYQPAEKYGPLHYFAIWCMEQSNFDDLTLFLVFCICAFIYLPLPEDNPAMPFFRLFLYFTMTILLYSASCRLPPKLRIIVHPIILTAACVMAGIAYFERIKGFDIKHGVNLYKSGITFISLVEKSNVGWPGGGDILSATMDVSIISLAFNVYKSRPQSLREWLVIFLSIVPMSFLIMFVTPLFARGIGCTPADSLVWSSRSVTTAIGIVIAKVLGAEESIVTCIIVFTGIMGPLIGTYLYKIARVKDDDYMTIGITMGSSSHGVGTAYLISKNPKASGMSSIAFAVFGTMGVIVASIPALSDTIKQLSGY